MQRIVISGCYHSLNSGVMAMAEAIIQNFPKADIYVLSSLQHIDVDRDRYSIYPNVQPLISPWFSGNKRINTLKILLSLLGIPAYRGFRRILNKTDYLIDISGDSISNDYGTKSILFQLLPILLAPKNVKVLFAPQSIGPIKGVLQTFLVRKGFRKSSQINLRETETLKYLDKFGKFKFNILADLAFLLKPTPVTLKIPIRDRSIGIGVSSLVKKFGAENSTVLFKNIIDKCLEHNYNILLINHVSTPQGNDILVANKIKEKYYSEDARVLNTNFNYRASEWKFLINQCSAMVSARMHPVIHALSLSIPSLNLSYNHKSIGVVANRFPGSAKVVGVTDKNVLNEVESFLKELSTIDYLEFEKSTRNNINLAQEFITQIK